MLKIVDGMWVICLDNVRNHCLSKKIKKDALLYVIRLPKDCTRFPFIRKCKYFHLISSHYTLL